MDKTMKKGARFDSFAPFAPFLQTFKKKVY